MERLKDDDPEMIGGYTLLGRIGAGGMGQVYLGESAAGQQVAVKVIRPSVLDEDARARFVLEVGSLKTVYGPFVAALVAADAQADRPWLAMEYVDGPDLLSFISEHGPLPALEAASLGALLAEGLATVHDAGLLHRDLKPQNILLAAYGPKVIDFGLAVLAERRSTLTATGFVVGSVLCMAPEQARGESELTRAADVYALGAVLLYAATGHYPYTGSTWQAVALKIEDPDTAPDLSGLGPAFQSVVRAMLALAPAARPPLEEVVEQLAKVITDAGLTVGQARRRLTARTLRTGLPELDDVIPPAVAYTPTLLDPAAHPDEDDDPPGLVPASGHRAPEPSAPESAARPVPEDGTGTSGRASTTPGLSRSRPTAPLEIAERMRAAYARDARF